MMEKNRTGVRIKSMIIVAIICALVGWLIRWGELVLRLPGTELVSDPREIFITIGAAITGPFVGAFIAALPNIASGLPPGAAIADGLGHVLGAVWFGLAYRYFIFDRRPYAVKYLLWAISLAVYYIIVIAFGMAFFSLWPEDYAWALGDIEVFQAIGISLRYIIPEAVFTFVVTALLLSIPPVKYRRPLWIPADHFDLGKTRT